MVPQVERLAADYGIPVHSSGGFDSLTAKHDLALLLAGWGRAEVLHLGDHDPSGVHVFSSLAEDLQALAGPDADLRFTRLAVTPVQITAMNLPTAPAKETDCRAFSGETVQAEAIPPDGLADIVRDAIAERLDHAAFAAVRRQEHAAREWAERSLLPLFDQADGGEPR